MGNQLLKSFQFQGPPDQGLSPDPAGGSAPRPRFTPLARLK